LPSGKTAGIEFAHQAEMSKPIMLNAFVGNRSVQPAFHTIVQLGLDTDISIPVLLDFTSVGERTDADGFPQKWFSAAFPRRPSRRFSRRQILT
jgi:hypothetical protein